MTADKKPSAAKKSLADKVKKAKRKGSRNRWIEHYMTWRDNNPEIVKNTKDIKELVKLARKTYTPSKRGYKCRSCGQWNSPPLLKE